MEPIVEQVLLLQLSFLSRPKDVSNMVRRAEDWLLSFGASKEFSGDLALVLAEALNNVVEHAYQYREDGVIDVELRFKSPELKITIQDKGKKFPGLPAKKIMDGPEQKFEDLPEGGFGWFLIQTLTTAIEYEHVAGENHLELMMSEAPSLPAKTA